MRIASVCYWNLDAGDGVARKLETQARLWREAGHEVELVAIRPGRRLEDTRRAVAAVERFEPDVVYVRHDLFLPPFGRLPRRFPTIVEVNTDEHAELRLRGVQARLYRPLNRFLLLRRAAGVVCVTEELAGGFRGPRAVVANGVDPQGVPRLPAPANARPRAVFSGSPGLAWHGVDRLLRLAAALPEIDFDLVGPRAEGAPPNVAMHGFLEAEGYWAVLAAADLAVGSLALDRAGLREGSPLKVREYLLAGIPTAIGYEDTDFPGEPPWYLLRLSGADPDPAALREFAGHVRGRRVPREEVEPRLSARVKEEQRLAFMAAVARKRAET